MPLNDTIEMRGGIVCVSVVRCERCVRCAIRISLSGNSIDLNLIHRKVPIRNNENITAAVAATAIPSLSLFF